MNSKKNACYWFLFYRDKLILKKEKNGYSIPFGEESPVPVTQSFEVDFSDNIPARAATLSSELSEDDLYISIGLRASWDYLSHDWYKRAGKAFQLVHWDRNSHFCPSCGSAMEWHTHISKYCPNCQKETYPVISPAIIVLIRKGDQVLLVHARNFRGSFYGLVAGFLEVGETLEQCVQREVMEETGLTINHLTYFGSQPWPYPSGIMVGFFADYVSGEVKLQKEELSTGTFFTKDHLPELPAKLSIARRMIEWWIAGEPQEKPMF